MSEQEKIISKVQKLLALSGSSNDNEAKAALVKAQELMVQYNITEDLLRPFQEQKVVDRYVHEVSAYNSWVRNLRDVIAKNFRCKSAISKNGNAMYAVFIGFESDTEIAANIFIYAVKFAERAGSNLAQTYNDKKLSSKGIKQDYVEGFVSGLEQGWKKQVLEGTENVSSEQFALALTVPAVVEKYVRDTCSKITIKCGHQNRAFDASAFQKGHESGVSFADMDGKKGIGER